MGTRKYLLNDAGHITVSANYDPTAAPRARCCQAPSATPGVANPRTGASNLWKVPAHATGAEYRMFARPSSGCWGYTLPKTPQGSLPAALCENERRCLCESVAMDQAAGTALSMAANSASLSVTAVAPRLSSTPAERVLQGIGMITGDLRSSQARTTW